MRRAPFSRAVATLVSLLFLLAWGEPVALHPCPMHDGHPATALAQGVEDAGQSVTTHDGHADHGRHVAATAPPAPAHDDGGHACQCLGHCCSASGVVLAPVQLARWQVVVTRRAEPPAPQAAELALVATPHALPFANGPPRLA